MPSTQKVPSPPFQKPAAPPKNLRSKITPAPPPQPRTSRPPRRNPARRLMPHHNRRNPPPRRPVIPMHIAAANPASSHANQHLASPRRRRWHVRNFKRPIFRQQQSFHHRFRPAQERTPNRPYSNPFGVQRSRRRFVTA